MTEEAETGDGWKATWEESRRQLLRSTLTATPAQRLAWLEEALELAHRAGALERNRLRSRETKQGPEHSPE